MLTTSYFKTPTIIIIIIKIIRRRITNVCKDSIRLKAGPLQNYLTNIQDYEARPKNDS